LFFALATVLTFLLATRINQNNQIKNLEVSNQHLREQIDNAEGQTAYYVNILKFAEDYALWVRGWGRPGTQIFG
jgi:hypothetical protein